MTIKEMINSLIQISQEKYGLLKIGKETLNQDLLFIEKFQLLKHTLKVESIDEVNVSDYPELKQLKIMIEEINALNHPETPKDMKLNKALKAYKKK